MSETLRDLVVSLSLESDNFTRNIKSVNKQIQEAESRFKLAAAGVENFETTTTGLTTKLDTLQRRMKLQQDVVDQYARALDAADAKLAECSDREIEYSRRLNDAWTAQQALKEQVRLAADQVKNYSENLGESHSATIAARANLDALKGEYRESVQEVKKLAGQHTALKKSMQNAADAVSTTGANLNMARAAVRNTEAEINKCNKALRLSQTNWKSAGDAISDSKQEITMLGKYMSLAQSKFRLATAGIKDMNTSVSGLSVKLTMLREKLELQEDSVIAYEKALRAANDQLEAAYDAGDLDLIRQADDAVTDAETALNNAKAAVRETRAAIEECNQALKTAQSLWTAAGQSLESFGKKCDSASKMMNTVGRTLTTTMTTPIVALGTAAVKASISYESAFTSVRKTVDATEAEFAQLSDEIKIMSTVVASSSDDIAEVVAIAGQLGIENDHLIEFARTMIDLGNSTDIVADQAASTLAKFANIMNMDQSLFGNLGATLVDLGNNYATTESAIMEMSMRLAAAGKQVGLSEAQILGFATALSSVGIEAQMGGSAFSKALVKMEVAAETGGEALDDFAKVSGMTAEQFKALWDTDPAGAFQAFIEGLAQMDDEGMSAIATLQEIGIIEVRLRDTLLRAVNANELFTETQITANEAWDENTALTEEAGKRYGTTASKLTNLKNKAVLFGQTLGDDLNPTIDNLIEGADELLDKFMDMDEAQRMQLMKFAAIAAASGPVVLGLSKITKGISVVSTGIGKFSTAVGKAGGGFKGFMSVLGKSPAVWVAIAAATVTATIAIWDYVSGAKQAREALEGMAETAENWKNTSADTFYGGDGLSFFGMSESDFTREVQSAQDWMSGLLSVWTDGQKESDEIVSEWTESFKALTAATRTELVQMRTDAQNAGYTGVVDQLTADIETLDSLDAEIEALLKKRQNGYFTEADQIRLQELIDTREAIEVKYKLSPDDVDGFDTIRQKLEAEVARAHARGQSDADAAVYENAMLAAAEGLAAVNAEIDTQYDKEYALIQMIEDSTERQAAMDDLNARYNENRRSAALEYAALLADVVMPVWEQEDIQQAAADVDLLTQKLREYSAASTEDKPALLEELNVLTAGMDESALTEYIAMLTQIQSLLDSGMTEAEVQALFPEIDFSTALEQLAAIQTFLNNHNIELPGLTAMFGEALPEELLTIATDLDMTGAQARWDEFAANPGAITTDAVILQYTEDQNTIMVQPQVDAFISKYTEIPEGASTAELTPDGLIAYVATFAEATSGADVSGLTPENVTAMVSAYQELATGADVTALTPDEITAYISSYLETEGVAMSGLTPDGITAFVLAYEEVEGGALTTSLTPENITAMVAKYLEAEGVDVSALKPDQVEAIVSSFAEATSCDKSTLLQDFTAYIAQYDDTNAVKPELSIKVSITGYDLAAYNDFVTNNPVEVEGRVRLGEVYDNPVDVLNADNVLFYENGQQITVDAVPAEKLTADTLFVYDKDGTMHVLITPVVEGTAESLDKASALLNSVEHQGSLGAKWFGDDTLTDITRLNEYLQGIDNEMNSWLNVGGWMNSYDRWAAENTLSNYLDPTEIGNIQAFVSEAIAAINSGETLSDDTIAKLQAILDLVNLLDAIGIGQNVTAGIAEGMTEAGFDTYAETVASNLETALNTALGIHSPSTRVKPVGENVSAGVGVGMAGYDFTPDATTLAANVEAAVRGSLTTATLRSAGVNAMAGLRAGIIAGRSGVISAMRSAARAAVNAAKAELKIHSPSQVFENEVGVQAMKGFGLGIEKEAKEQAQIIRNASRYLTGEAREGTIVMGSTDNRRTYNQNVTSTIQVQQMVVRDEQDIRSLAVEIATLTRRQQRGKGLRLA